MATKQSLKARQKQEAAWPVLLGLSLLLILIAYGFASWAIDSGNLLHYGLAILFLVLAAREIKRGVASLRRK